ncbi:hypothetical protein BJ912DRAFT_924033 [Pholiota molesta]|nr:hypothetical protein BJ912DRAFT_924033 [Pholiota molesta]
MPHSPIPHNRRREDDRRIKFEERVFVPWPPNEQVLYLADGSLRLRLDDLEFSWFTRMLRQVPRDLDLATLLRERALQYGGCDISDLRGRDCIARGSLAYIQVWHTIFKSRPPPAINECIICEECEDASVVISSDRQNRPQPDAAAFLPSPTPEALPGARKVDNDIDEILSLCSKLAALSLSDPHGADAETRGTASTSRT